MIGFACCVGDQAKFARFALPGLRLAAEPDAVIADTTAEGSIAPAYNEILDAFAAMDGLEALVLLHEDCEIVVPDFCARVRAQLADPGVAILGVVGAIGVTSLRWWEGAGRGHVRETRGTVDFGGGAHDVDAVDGLLMVLSPWAVRELRCDTGYEGFHAYDVDLCFEARKRGKRVRVADLPVVHHTKGGYGDEAAYARADQRFREKWHFAPAERPDRADAA